MEPQTLVAPSPLKLEFPKVETPSIPQFSPDALQNADYEKLFANPKVRSYLKEHGVDLGEADKTVTQERMFGGGGTFSVNSKTALGLPVGMDVIIAAGIVVFVAPPVINIISGLLPVPAIPMVPNARAIVVEGLVAFGLIKFGKSNWAKIAALLLTVDALGKLILPLLPGVKQSADGDISQFQPTTKLALSRNTLAGV